MFFRVELLVRAWLYILALATKVLSYTVTAYNFVHSRITYSIIIVVDYSSLSWESLKLTIYYYTLIKAIFGNYICLYIPYVSSNKLYFSSCSIAVRGIEPRMCRLLSRGAVLGFAAHKVSSRVTLPIGGGRIA